MTNAEKLAVLEKARKWITLPGAWGRGWHPPLGAATTKLMGPWCAIEMLNECGDKNCEVQQVVLDVAKQPLWKVNDHQGLGAVLWCFDEAIKKLQ